jgi:hypothetical protein
MNDTSLDSLTETGTVMGELVAKAREARAQGRSRRDFFTATAKIAGATAMGAAGAKLMLPLAAKAATTNGAPSADTVADIVNLAATAEALAITFYNRALESNTTLLNVNSSANRNYFQAALSQELEHLELLRSLGGRPLASRFYFPEDMFIKESVFFPTAMTLEKYFISAYIAAALDFSGAWSSNITAANPKLLGAAVQICGVECEHQALLGVAANINPPNAVLVEQALLTSVLGAVTPLTPFLQGGSGFVGSYSAPDSATIQTNAAPYTVSSFPKPVYI